MSTRGSRPQERPSTPVGRKLSQKDIPIVLGELSEKVDNLQKLSKGQTSIMTKTMQSGNWSSRDLRTVPTLIYRYNLVTKIETNSDKIQAMSQEISKLKETSTKNGELLSKLESPDKNSSSKKRVLNTKRNQYVGGI